MQLVRVEPEQESEQVAAAAAALADGRVVVLPTETTPALAADASDPEAVDRLWRIKSTDREPLALHLPRSGMSALHEAGGLSALQRRAIDKFVPGPLELHIPLDAAPAELTPASLDVPAEVVTLSDHLMVRAPAHPFAQAVLEAASGTPIVMASASIRDATTARTVPLACQRFEALDESRQPAIGFDALPEPLGRPSSAVRFEADGSVTMIREGALEERYFRSRLPFVVLFVCTGNTCRSPMAEVIARSLIAEPGPGDVPIEVRSAGTTAMDGAPATPEAVEAVASMSLDLSGHRSSALTRAALEDADAVFAMTSSHAMMAAQIHPALGDSIQLLDPDGNDIQDPIGMSQQVYAETAERLRTLIARRLEELAPSGVRTP